MHIQYCSDLHLEFPENRKFLFGNPLQVAGDILVIAGDLVTFRDEKKADPFFDYVSDRYSSVYWVPGNHEYYGYDLALKPRPLYEQIRSNVFLVNDHVACVDDVELIFTTLWSRVSPTRAAEMQRSISDFSLIEFHGKKLNASAFTELHENSVRFLEGAAGSARTGARIVVTHHVPTLLNYPSVYRNSPLTEAFATELSDVIETLAADAWIYGHHHVNVPAFPIGSTQMLTNQLGYVSHYEYRSFSPAAVVETISSNKGI